MFTAVINAVARPEARIFVLSPTGTLQPHTAHPPLVAPSHHQYYELAICYAGKMSFVGYANTLALERGDAVIIKPSAWHYESYRRANQSYRVCWLSASPQATHSIFTYYRRGTFTTSAPQGRPPSDEPVIFTELSRELIEQPLHWREKSRALLVQLLVDYTRRLRIPQPAVDRQAPDPARKLLRIVQARFRNPLQIKELAKEVGLSADHLSRRFTALCGQTFKDYLNTIRIHHAQQLLKSGRSIKQTAEECGFSDVYYFGRVFKERCGIAPGQFVRSH